VLALSASLRPKYGTPYLFSLHIRQSQTYSSFRIHLKTYYFLLAHLAPGGPDSLPRLWRYTNLLLTYLLTNLEPKAKKSILHMASNTSASQRVTFKIALLVWKSVHGAAPAYLQQLCVKVEDVRGCPRLRSASTRCIQLPRVRTSVWNSLPSTLRDSSLSLRAFKWRLKTYLFGRGQ